MEPNNHPIQKEYEDMVKALDIHFTNKAKHLKEEDKEAIREQALTEWMKKLRRKYFKLIKGGKYDR